MPSAIGFDFDHTLGIDNKLERTVALQVLGERAAESGVVFDPDAALHRVEATLVAYRSGSETFNVAWAGLCADLIGGDTQTFVEEFTDRCVEAVPSFVKALPGARELIDALTHRNVPFAMLTNGWSPLQEAKAEAVGFTSAVLVSERIGVRKPSAAAFARLQSVLGVPASEIMYVGDDPRADVDGSQAAGFIGVWFDWEGIAYPADCAKPDHTITALMDVLSLL